MSAPGLNPRVNDGLGGDNDASVWFVHCNKSTTLVRDVWNGGGYAWVEVEVYEKYLCLLLILL